MTDRPLTQNIPPSGAPATLADYEKSGGYQALKRARTALTPTEVVKLVTDSGLRGRGGAGFPTGQKWSFVPMGETAGSKYLVANADEMEPGTFKDRLLMEGDPHQLVEGVAIAAHAIEAETAYVFVRGEYVEPARRVRQAIAEAKSKGLLGDLEIHVHTSAGRYICGEETALLNALEGKRALPRGKPPFPQASGLWGRPTVVNNVETLCNLPHILRNGADWFKSLSRGAVAGTKLYGASGRVKRPGVWELPMGTTVREILDEHAGGLQDGLALKGLLPGGASTDFLTPDHLDTPMDFESVAAAGSRLGTGTMIVLDDRTCPLAMLINLERFFAQESCGWCTPCRDGLPWVVSILEGIEAGRGGPEDIELLAWHAHALGPGHTFCAHAPGAMEPLQSALKHFRADFERHIEAGRCPWRAS